MSTIYEDSAANLWIGTAAGLALFRDGRIQHIALGPAALHAPILGIAEDRTGSLWIAAADRVVSVARDRLVRGEVDDDALRAYGASDGLLGVESVKRHRSLVADSRGRIWLSMNRGLSMVDPVRAAALVAPALVNVEGVSADGRTFASHGDITIPPRRRRITIAFTGLSLAVPERLKFRYRLDGFDRDWSQPATLRQAEYTNLGPGTYQFRVVSSNSDGAWSPVGSTMQFTIAAAYWQTIWFRLAAVALLGAAGWGAYQRARGAGGPSAQPSIRGAAGRAHAHRAGAARYAPAGVSQRSMQLHVAADRLPGGSPARSSLDRVLDLMARVIEEGRNAVRGLRSSGSASYDLEQAFSGIAEEFATGGQPEYCVIVEGHVRPLNPMVRDDIYRIGREAVTNAFRHSAAKKVEIELDYASSGLRLLVRDNGRGMEPQIVRSGSEGHWGLLGMRERAERIGARLQGLEQRAGRDRD